MKNAPDFIVNKVAQRAAENGKEAAEKIATLQKYWREYDRNLAELIKILDSASTALKQQATDAQAFQNHQQNNDFSKALTDIFYTASGNAQRVHHDFLNVERCMKGYL